MADQPDAQAQAPEPERPISTQIKLSSEEMRAIGLRIEDDRRESYAAFQWWRDKCADEEEAWRRIVDPWVTEGSNLRVPLTTAILLAKHAREIDAIYGANASITATPRGPTDSKLAGRVGLALSWQFFENSRAIQPLAIALLRRLKHGVSFVYAPHERKFYPKTTIDERTGKRTTEQVCYWEGTSLYPMNNDDIILPASIGQHSDIASLQDADFVGRRYYATPTELLSASSEPGEAQNPGGDLYQGIGLNWRDIVRRARDTRGRKSEGDESRTVSDAAQGVDRSSNSQTSERLEILEWYMNWRRWADVEDEGDGLDGYGSGNDFKPDNAAAAGIAGLRRGDAPFESGMAQGSTEDKAEGAEYQSAGAEAADLAEAGSDAGQVFEDGTFIDPHDGRRKRMVETRLIVRYSEELQMVVGIQDACEVYPDTPNKIPILKFSLFQDGQFFCMSLIELCQQIEIEMSKLLNKVITGTDMSIAPPLFVTPRAGEKIANGQYQAHQLIYTDDPNSMKQAVITVNLESVPLLWNIFKEIYEQVTGITAYNFGRSMDQPNAGRTLGQTRIIVGAGDVRMALDMRNLSEDLRRLIDHVWSQWRMFGSEQQFYRVAEGSSQGAFKPDELNDGWAKMGPKEFNGNFDLSFEFADGMALKEARRAEALALIQALVVFPRVQQDLQYQDRLINYVLAEMGYPAGEFGPEPAAAFFPQLPETEWTKMLEGEDVHVHPDDNDDAHIADHKMRALAMGKGPPEDIDNDAILRDKKHIADHEQQKQMKLMAQAVAQAVTALGVAAGAQGAGGAPGQAGGLGAMVGGMAGAGGQAPMQGGMGQ